MNLFKLDSEPLINKRFMNFFLIVVTSASNSFTLWLPKAGKLSLKLSQGCCDSTLWETDKKKIQFAISRRSNDLPRSRGCG